MTTSGVDPLVVFLVVAGALFLIGVVVLHSRRVARRRRRARGVGLVDFRRGSLGAGTGAYGSTGSWSGDSWGTSGDLGGDSGGDGGGGD